jgi:hypothetical protein
MTRRCRRCGHFSTSHSPTGCYAHHEDGSACDCRRPAPEPDPRKLARRGDHDSSHDAAEHAASTFVSQHEQKILEALNGAAHPLNAVELSMLTGLTTVQVQRRLGTSGLCAEGGPVEAIKRPGNRLRWRLATSEYVSLDDYLARHTA